MDKLTPDARSALMRKVKGADTTPERLVRKLLYAAGYRYRLHDHRVAGRPDVSFFSRRKAVFVHGCFWHGHHCRAGRNRPASNETYWTRKLARTMERDRAQLETLTEDGWRTLVVWECETRDVEALRRRLIEFMET